MVTTGYGGVPYAGILDNTELIDLSGDCTSTLPNYPAKYAAGTGQFIDGKVVICGGYNYQGLRTSDCYQLSKGSSSFVKLSPSMQVNRYRAKSIITQGRLWITGGQDEYKNKLSSSEFIQTSNNSESIPMGNIELPEPISGHAVISLNSSTSMLIGGTHNIAKTHLYDHLSSTWTVGPELITGRHDHAAGLIMDHTTHQQHIAVVGGQNYEHLDSLELMFHGTNQWEIGN